MRIDVALFSVLSPIVLFAQLITLSGTASAQTVGLPNHGVCLPQHNVVPHTQMNPLFCLPVLPVEQNPFLNCPIETFPCPPLMTGPRSILPGRGYPDDCTATPTCPPPPPECKTCGCTSCKSVEVERVRIVEYQSVVPLDEWEVEEYTVPFCETQCDDNGVCTEKVGTRTVKRLVKRTKLQHVTLTKPEIYRETVNLCVTCEVAVKK
ncbi:hypothetical protein [Stieleria varia]|uniref:Uncharacterized protein n=1 Tax=Stieleria varia TaxID=2528005 RepID=A0A5C6AXD0_9BACT|nr:hypothetical protein [Stieleria varia]TWU02784.1 hypothetical protein Pla52n_38430 [Stieleria varia]